MKSKAHFWTSRGSPLRGNWNAAAQRCAISLTATIATLVQAGQVPPVIATKFEIQATNFNQNFKPQERASCESAIGSEIAALGTDYFGCFRWLPQVNDANMTNCAGTLKVELSQEDRGYGYNIFLGYTRIVNGQSAKLDFPAPTLLYAASRLDQPTQDPNRLQADIITELRRQFQNQELRKHFQEEFLSLIPLADTIEVATNVERVIIPISWEALRATEKSVLLVRFQTQSGTANPLPVMIKMSPKEKNLPGSWGLNVGCLVIEFDRPPVFSRDGWHRLIPESYAQRVNGTAGVYVSDYYKDYSAGTTGSLADKP